MTRRLLLVALCLLGTAGYLRAVSRAESVPVRESLHACPLSLGDWTGRPGEALDARTLKLLGVDEYLNRAYTNARRQAVGLYIGYYGSQKHGDTMHSPLNCLPGAGWTPVRAGHLHIDVIDVPVSQEATPRTIEVNRFLIEKGLERLVVLYWYHAHGRVIASEYWGKFYLILDAIRTNRTNGALVRIVAPIDASEQEAERSAVDFVQTVYPVLERHLP